MEAHACSICDHYYNTSKKRPLVLPCSHSFCQECLQHIAIVGVKRCPVCRKSWRNVSVSDLPSCYQLIPAEGHSENDCIQKALNVIACQVKCLVHDKGFCFWCESCGIPACRECLKLKHKSCQLVLIEEKEDMLREQQERDLVPLKEKMVKYSELSEENEDSLAIVKSLAAKMKSLTRVMVGYKASVAAWQFEAQKILSDPAKSSRALSKLAKQQDSEQYDWTDLEELERAIGRRPSSLLVHVAATFQDSNEDINGFIYNLKNSLDATRKGSPSCDKSLAARRNDLSIREAVAALTDGGLWVVSDATSAAAVQTVLQTTSIRPVKVQVIWKNIPDELLLELQTFTYSPKSYEVEATDVMPCFPHSAAPCTTTRAATTARLDTWTKPAGWASLTQFWGHLDAAAVQKLPATIRSVGLVLRDHLDVKAVDALWEAAVKKDSYEKDRSCLKWSNWTDLNLSVAKSFRPELWPTTLPFEASGYRRGTRSSSLLSLSAALPSLGVRLSLHLPQLSPGDCRWLGYLIGAVGVRRFGGRVPLLLPGARIDLDPLLGVLRDSGQCWELHLPVSLPQLTPREGVAERYNKYGHSVTWDLE